MVTVRAVSALDSLYQYVQYSITDYTALHSKLISKKKLPNFTG